MIIDNIIVIKYGLYNWTKANLVINLLQVNTYDGLLDDFFGEKNLSANFTN